MYNNLLFSAREGSTKKRKIRLQGASREQANTAREQTKGIIEDAHNIHRPLSKLLEFYPPAKSYI
jgi:hypothetical protein